MRLTANHTPGAPEGAPGVASDLVLRWAVVVALMIVALLGVLHLPTAFSGDAALYQTGARTLDEGGALYRDHWDLKSPGIYMVHWAAGTLFGFGEEGVHLFELLLLLALCVAQVRLLAPRLTPRWLAAVAPLAGVGTYYAVASEWHLTQPAVLLSAPLFAVLAVLAADRATAWRWAGAGAAAAVAFLLKPYSAGIVLALLVASAMLRLRLDREPPTVWLRRRLAPFVGAAAVLVVLTLLHLRAVGGLADFLWTHSEWRTLATQVRGDFPVMRAVWAVQTFVGNFGPWLVLLPAARMGWRGVQAERLFVLAAVWLGAALVVTSIEPFAAWEFDFLALKVPVALLAARGLHGLHAWWLARGYPSGRRLTLATIGAVTVALVALGGEALVERAHTLARFVPLSRADAHEYRLTHDERYARLWSETAFLRDPASRPGPVYVFGDPLRHLHAERPAASPIHGWAWELQPQAMWERVVRDLEVTGSAYIYVSHEYERLIAARAPRMQDLLARRYRPHREGPDGRWYERTD